MLTFLTNLNFQGFKQIAPEGRKGASGIKTFLRLPDPKASKFKNENHA